jgi:SAM-dependent methyltransferase
MKGWKMLKQLEIGCGGSQRTWPGYENYGTDIVDMSAQRGNFKKADLIIDPIPWEDNFFDLVTADDFLEHIPMVLYIPKFETPYAGTVAASLHNYKLIRKDVMIGLFDEIYRVLKPDGLFYAHVPCYPDRAIFQDPQHVSFWTDETPHYFSGDYYGFHGHYGHTSDFILLKNEKVGMHLNFTMKAIKPPRAEKTL